MFMKHYAPTNRCESSIEALNFGGEGGGGGVRMDVSEELGGVRVDVDGEVSFWKKNWGGGGGGGRVGGGVRVDVNEELKFLRK